MKLIRPSNTRAMEDLIQSLPHLQPTYAEIGDSLQGKSPPGFHHHHYQIELRANEEVFDRAVYGLQTWQAHLLARVAVYPKTQPVTVGNSVLLALGPRAVAIAAPCRIVEVIHQSNSWGFAYGTLLGHPECGEEAFIVSKSPDGMIAFDISGFSRPASYAVRISGPIAHTIQSNVTRAYLKALKRFAEG